MDAGHRSSLSSTPSCSRKLQATTARLIGVTSISSSPSSLINGKSLGLNGAFTKGGAAKRVFKPTIPNSRRSKQDDSNNQGNGDDNQKLNGSAKGKRKNKSSNDSKANKGKGKKELIQLDAVFNGINAASLPKIKTERQFGSGSGPGCSGLNLPGEGRILRSSSQANGDNHDSSAINGIRFKQEEGWNKSEIINDDANEVDISKIEKMLYRDDFIDWRNTNDDDKVPIGWEHVNRYRTLKTESDTKEIKKEIKPIIPFDEWATTDNKEDKMVLFQLPEMLLNSGEGKLGKIKIYQSGRMELVDTRTGLVYDLLHTNNFGKISDNLIKKDPSDDTSVNNTINCANQSQSSINCDESYPLHREAVTFDGKEIVCLGSISDNQLLIGRPRIEPIFNH